MPSPGPPAISADGLMQPILKQQSSAPEPGTNDAFDALVERLRTAERRQHVRFNLNVAGRYMCEDKSEYPCAIVDISVGSAAITTSGPACPGEQIIAYFDRLGGIQGSVFKVTDDGFVMLFNIGAQKRERLAAQLTLFVNSDELDPEDLRRSGHNRIMVADKDIKVTRDDGSTMTVTLADVSVSGALLLSNERPPITSLLTVGRLRAKVVRHHESGFAVQFQNSDGTDLFSIISD